MMRHHKAVIAGLIVVLKLLPEEPADHYNLACAQARQRKTKEALKSLAGAVADGFNDVKLMRGDADLANIRGEPEFQDLLEKAKVAVRPQRQRQITPLSAHEGKVLVADRNTAWDARNGILRAFFKMPDGGRSGQEVAVALRSAR